MVPPLLSSYRTPSNHPNQVKEFNDECCKNEVLIAKCKEYKIDI